VYIIRTR